MKDHIAYNDRLFSRWAPVYDGFELLLYAVRNKVVQQINPTNAAVLDIATGTGSLAIALSATANSVVGVDLSAKMLEVAKRKKYGSNLSFLQMDASSMTFPNQEFDVVTISLGLHDMPVAIRTAVLQEAKRVLKPDGKLYILEYDLPTTKLSKVIATNLINTFESRYFKPFTQLNFTQYLTDQGFTIHQKTSHLFSHLQLLSLSVK